MNWRDIDWNVATLGRLAAIAIIVGGIIVAALDASALELGSAGVGSYFKFRFFLHHAIGYAWKGGLVFAGAEIANRLGWGGRSGIDWRGTQFLRLLGLAVIVVGIGTTVWDLTEFESFTGSMTSRVLMHSVIASLWQGGMLILAAELAERIGWRRDTPDIAAEAPA